MDVKYNINKIHGCLLNEFGEVSISEKSNIKMGSYFEISTGIKEQANIKIVIPMKNLERDTFEWSYFSNTLNENSYLVERTSSIYSISDDIKDIIYKKRFVSDYIDELNKSKEDSNNK